ncbi:MAG TPA: ATP-binding cassette domain-containing protein [Polyangiaceae bacterium]|nr:ATP-binding cassette domain-containing protein [Polyangiaceae bacterium]
MTAPRIDSHKQGRGIDFDRVSFYFGELLILRSVTFHIPRGDALVLTGANGVGKSTLLQLCAGLLQPTSGETRIAGHKPHPERPSDLFDKGVRVGFVFQDGALLHNMSALANVTLALSYHAELLGLDEKGIDARARGALLEVGINQADFHASPAHLSHGVKKRVAVARALALEPNFVFFDDPDTGMDPKSLQLMHDVIERFCQDKGVTAVVVTNHDRLMDRLGVRPHALLYGELVELPLPSERFKR